MKDLIKGAALVCCLVALILWQSAEFVSSAQDSGESRPEGAPEEEAPESEANEKAFPNLLVPVPSEPAKPFLSKDFWKLYDQGLEAIDLNRDDTAFEKLIAGDNPLQLGAVSRSMKNPELLPAETQRIVKEFSWDPLLDCPDGIHGVEDSAETVNDIVAFVQAQGMQIPSKLTLGSPDGPSAIKLVQSKGDLPRAVMTLSCLSVVESLVEDISPSGEQEVEKEFVRNSMSLLLGAPNDQPASRDVTREDITKRFAIDGENFSAGSDTSMMISLRRVGIRRYAASLCRMIQEIHTSIDGGLVAPGETLTIYAGYPDEDEEGEGPKDGEEEALPKWTPPAPFPLLVIGGEGDTTYDLSVSPLMLVDLGGNDVYRGAVAAATPDNPIAMLCDFGEGNDRYESVKLKGMEHQPIGPCGAWGGMAYLEDYGGNDTYVGGDVSCGAAWIGAARLIDHGGSDSYTSRQFGQGAACMGYGELIDKGTRIKLGDDADKAFSNDTYTVGRYGQGFGYMLGYGRLEDDGGNDTYTAGGLYRHTPLLPDRYQSMSQGFGWGLRGLRLAGGVGVLVDKGQGVDTYSADVYAQGASYWYALGILWDEGGNDRYIMGQYGQGAGIHLSAGILVDLDGHDYYNNFNGVGTGGAHDYAIGWLIDLGKGDDAYYSNGLAQGLNNSVAVLYDEAGSDTYASRANNGIAYGHNRSAALLIDGGGYDRYTVPVTNGLWYRRNSTGLVMDLLAEGESAEKYSRVTTSRPRLDDYLPKVEEAVGEEKKPETAKVAPPVPSSAPKNRSKAELEKLWEIACRWQVGTEAYKQEILDARRTLVEEGNLEFLISRIGETYGLNLRAMHATIPLFGERAIQPLMFHALRGDEDPAKARNAIELLGRTYQRMKSGAEESGANEAVNEHVSGDLPKLLEGIAKLPRDRQLGAYQSMLRYGDAVELVPHIQPFVEKGNDRERKTATETLAGMKMTKSIHGALTIALNDQYYAVREAALRGMIGYEVPERRPARERTMAQRVSSWAKVMGEAKHPQVNAKVGAYQKMPSRDDEEAWVDEKIGRLNDLSLLYEGVVRSSDANRKAKLAAIAALNAMVDGTPDLLQRDEFSPFYPSYLYGAAADGMIRENTDSAVLGELYQLQEKLMNRETERDRKKKQKE